jgi:hypothetical protein
VDEMDKALTWLAEQVEPAKQKFRKYLAISKSKPNHWLKPILVARTAYPNR